jgi:hypothetical protein
MSKAARYKIACGFLGCQGKKNDKDPDLPYSQNSHTYLPNHISLSGPLNHGRSRIGNDTSIIIFMRITDRYDTVLLQMSRCVSTGTTSGPQDTNLCYPPLLYRSILVNCISHTSHSMFSVVSCHHSVEPHTLSCAAYIV